MNKALVLAGVLTIGALAGCKTITEELPTAPSSRNGAPVVNVPVPVQVTPVTLPQPETPAPAPAPPPSTPSQPTAPPPSAPEDGADPGNDFIPDNNNPVAKAIAKVYFVECDGSPVPGSENAGEAPVGCRVHLDVTPKDAGGKPTRPRNDPVWFYSNPGLFSVQGRSAFNPVLLPTSPGSTTAYAIVDGVSSNTFSIRFQ